MWGNTGIGVVIYGMIRMYNLRFTYAPTFTISLV